MDFNILECRLFIARGGKKKITRTVNNYEIDFYLEGNREIYINGNKNDIKDNTVCCRMPGQSVYSFGDYNCYVLTVDFSKLTSSEHYSRNVKRISEPLTDNPLVSHLPQSFVPKHASELRLLFAALVGQPDFESEKSGLLAEEILYLINADSVHELYGEQSETVSVPDLAAMYIHKNFKKSITLENIADYVHLEKSYFIRIFKDRFGKTPMEYLICDRLRYAQTLLINTDLTIASVAEECGYNQTPFFITSFKSHYGITPKMFRNNNRSRIPSVDSSHFESQAQYINKNH